MTEPMTDERLAKSFPYTTPSGHTYNAPTDYASLSARMMDYLQSVIECWDEDESPPNPLTFHEFAKIAWNQAVHASEDNDRLRAELAELKRYTSALEENSQTREAILRAEVERYRAWVGDLQSGMYVNCVYCGHRYGPGETTPVSMADALKAHVEECPHHPMSALRRENERLKAKLSERGIE